MKLTSQQIERIALWAVVLILILVVVFSQRRSGFTPSTGAPISLMDLQEYSTLTEKQKMNYKTELLNKMSTLNSIMTNDNTSDVKYKMYSDELSAVMKSAMTSQQPPVPQAQPPAPQEQPPVPQAPSEMPVM